jgi:hypothetical protein
MIAGAVPVKRPNLPRTTRGRILATLREAGRPLSRTEILWLGRGMTGRAYVPVKQLTAILEGLVSAGKLERSTRVTPVRTGANTVIITPCWRLLGPARNAGEDSP